MRSKAPGREVLAHACQRVSFSFPSTAELPYEPTVGTRFDSRAFNPPTLTKPFQYCDDLTRTSIDTCRFAPSLDTRWRHQLGYQEVLVLDLSQRPTSWLSNKTASFGLVAKNG